MTKDLKKKIQLLENKTNSPKGNLPFVLLFSSNKGMCVERSMGLCGNFARQSGYKMQTKNLKSFFVGFVIKCHLTTYRASRNRFSGISFNDYLHYCGAFLAHFLMKINRNIISSLRRIFSLCARVGRCDVCTDFTNVIKVDVDVNEMSLLNI